MDNRWLSNENATISVLDLSVLRGYGVNDYVRTYGRKFFKLEEHIHRFQKSAKELELRMPVSNDRIAAIIEEAKEHIPSGEISVKLILTGGVSLDQFLPADNGTFFIVAYPFIPFSDLCFEKGIHMVTECYVRPLPNVKSTHYLLAIAAVKKARKQGAIDVLFHNERGDLLESSTANFFAVKKGCIITPASSILKGITRQVVLKIASERVLCEERKVHINEIPLFDGAFLTSSNKGIMPISQIDEHSLPIPEEVRMLMQEFACFTARYSE